MTAEIASDFPFESRFVEVRGAQMHYVDEGEGNPILFLHGNPTSSYLWRNVIPHVTPFARAIAPDLIGMGKSDKLSGATTGGASASAWSEATAGESSERKFAYRFFDHVPYVEGFIEALGLRNVTLVLHDWGSALGFHYARRHEQNVRGLAFMEAIVRPSKWSRFPSGWKTVFRFFRTPGPGELLIQGLNIFVRGVLPMATVRKLSAEELARYAEPYPTFASRRPILRWPREIPINGRPADVHEAVAAYARWLEGTPLPKLLLYARPGGLIDAAEAGRLRDSLSNLTVVDIGPGIHYVQEDNPHGIGEAIAEWWRRL